MTHLAYIIPAYALTIVTCAAFALDAWRRTVRARRRLAALDPRARP